eukprot:TRINITY_DN1799_c0_g1_i12.p1 TRINITY_DN1799_c0_g1~~TRINITY_DN1799_c0_g1_i12.p1  ORF type:complete len:494 (-),score=37.19 TRINITY_DN1799_c0_g1_i12:283-1617(-)
MSHSELQVIPKNYLCPISMQVMKEPVVVLETGEMYDKKSLDQIEDQNFEKLTIFPLQDLQNVIQIFLKKQEERSNLQPEETAWLESEKISNVNQNQRGFRTTTELYQDSISEVKNQNEVVKKIVTEIQSVKDSWSGILLEYKIFGFFFESIRSDECSSEKILSISQKANGSDGFFGKCAAYLSNLYTQKYKFERELDKLVILEKTLTTNRIKFEEDMVQANIKMTLTHDFENVSEKYTKTAASENPETIDEQDLEKLFQTKNISNVSINLQKKCKKIIVSENKYVEGLKITQKNKTQNYIIIQLKAKIFFKDCTFDGIGLWVTGDTTYNVEGIFCGVKFLNSPWSGLVVERCNSILMHNILIQNSGLYGTYIESVLQYQLEECCVANCKDTGIYLISFGKGEMANCCVQKCGGYGVSADKLLIGRNVQFDRNKSGPTNKIELFK